MSTEDDPANDGVFHGKLFFCVNKFLEAYI